MDIVETLKKAGIIPVIVIEDAAKAVPLARALVKGGLPVLEVTFRTAAAAESIAAIKAEVPEAVVGAGTLLTPEMVKAAVAAGAAFGVAPGFDPVVVAAAKEADILIYNSSIDAELYTIDELLAKDALFADFRAVKEGNVWCTGKNMFQESSAIADMILEMHRT
jgi:ABC-type Fe3+-hydroxamate transport system substrate-binding protein